MLTGLADFALAYSEPYITPHARPIPLKLQFGEHLLDPCVSLLVGVPYQLPADGNWADHPLSLWVSAVYSENHGQQTVLPDLQ